MSSTQWATRSRPMVSWRSSAMAIFSLVPTPSVLLTRTGSWRPPPSATSPLNAPRSPSTRGPPSPEEAARAPQDARTAGLIRSTARSPAAMSTPAWAYAEARGRASVTASPWERGHPGRPGVRCPGRSRALQDELPLVALYRHRVPPVEAGVAEGALGQPDRLDQSVDAQVTQAVGADVIADL